MKPIARLGALLGAVTLAHAADDPILQTLTQAAQRLSQQPSYAWHSTSSSAEGTLTWRQGPTEGKTEAGRLTFVHFTLGSHTVEIALRDSHAAIRWEDQWRSQAELQGDVSWLADRLKRYRLPAAEARFLAEQAERLQHSPEGVITGQLKPAAILDLLSRGRTQFTEVPHVQGVVRFSLRDGKLAKYEYTLQGQLRIDPAQPEVALNRTTAVVIQEVGTTRVTLPEEALKKLDPP